MKKKLKKKKIVKKTKKNKSKATKKVTKGKENSKGCKKKVVKTKVGTEQQPDIQKAVDYLIAKGAERGFVTRAEILLSLPHFEDDVSSVESVMDQLDSEELKLLILKLQAFGRLKMHTLQKFQKQQKEEEKSS